MTETQVERPPAARVALVSGGSRGLGQALVEQFLARGYQVATFSRSENDFVRRITKRADADARVYWEPLDIAKGDVKGFVNRVHRRFGRLDVLVNNAGVGGDGVLATMSSDAMNAVLDCNLRGPLTLTKQVIRKMMLQASGSIVNISSVNGVRGHAGVAVYSATKAALDGMTRSLARELGRKGIRVNSVSPGYFESDMVGPMAPSAIATITRRTPLGRLARADEVAKAVLFVAADADFVTGQNIVIDGGLTC